MKWGGGGGGGGGGGHAKCIHLGTYAIKYQGVLRMCTLQQHINLQSTSHNMLVTGFVTYICTSLESYCGQRSSDSYA